MPFPLRRALLGALLASLLAGGATAQIGRPLVVQTRSAGSAERTALLQAADRRGSMRVIIGLDVAMPSSEELAPAAAAAERQTLRAAQAPLLDRLGVARSEATPLETVPYMVATLTPEQLRRLLADPQVTSVQEDVAIPAVLAESVPLIHADVAATRGFDGAGYSVAVLDTGVAKGHPMLAGKVVAEACYSSTTTQARSLCRNGTRSDVTAGAARPCPAELSGCDHGTHVASIAVGNGAGLAGVARNADLVAIQVFSRFNDPDACGVLFTPCPLAYYSDIVRGLERVYALRKVHRIAAANISIAGGSFAGTCNDEVPALTAVIERLFDAGVPTVVAAGNEFLDGAIGAPACIGRAIAVGSTTDKDRVSTFSNLSPVVDLLAPGSNIRAAVPGGGLGIKSGTSMAAPHVAGLFAILHQARPAASVPELRRAEVCTGVPVGRRGVSKSRVDAARALREIRNPGSVCPGPQA